MWIERPPEWFRKLFPGALFRLPASEPGKKRVYLTFDDGPIPEVTPRVLDILDRYGIKATFFMVGQNIERHPDLLEIVRSRGHSVGNHTLHHMKGMTATVKEYLEDSRRGEMLTGSALFRPPHGWLSPKKLKAVKKRYTVVMYDLVTRDYSHRLSAEDVTENVKRLARDGSIIVFHDSLKSWPRLQQALPDCLEWLISQKYEFHVL